MKISYNWLKNYIKDLPTPEKVAETFTFHICELESFDKLEAFGKTDWIFDIKVLPDRAHDLLSHKGVAKDLAGILGLSFNDIKYEKVKGDLTNLKIELKTEKCRRYIGRIVRDVKVGPSPEWMKNYLELLGQRSINNIVDATNIVMFDLGQPIHAFDLDKLASEEIVIRDASEGESMTTLDGKNIKFSTHNMVIADKGDALAIAGIKGGKKAEVDIETKNIIIEVANFDPTSVRKTAKAVNIYTDAVKRFENDLSLETAEMAMDEITALILEICPQVKAEEIVDVYPKKQEKKILKFNIKRVSKILGLEIDEVDVDKYFKNYNLDYKKDGDEYEFETPFNRPDLAIVEDMAEELGRFLGYDKIEAKLPEIKPVARFDEQFSKIQAVRQKFLSDGYSEVMTYAFCDSGEVEVLASASNKKFLRNNLHTGIYESLVLNKLNIPLLNIKEVKIFEIGTVFFKDREEVHVAWNEKGEIKELSLDKTIDHFSISIKAKIDILDFKNYSLNTSFKMWSLYPFISRDIAVWMPEGENPEKLKNILTENSTELLVREPYLFDSFTKNGKTSYAFRLVFQSYERTLTDDEVNKIMEKINQKIVENKDWVLR